MLAQGVFFVDYMSAVSLGVWGPYHVWAFYLSVVGAGVLYCWWVWFDLVL